jgi:hypothetical protein
VSPPISIHGQIIPAFILSPIYFKDRFIRNFESVGGFLKWSVAFKYSS